MKVIVSGSRRLFFRPTVIACAAVVVVTVAASLILFGGEQEVISTAAVPSPEVTSTVAQVDTGAMAVSAVLGTLENYGAFDADQAVSIWADGVAARNGVTQYSVMSMELKDKYLEVVNENGGSLLFPTSATQIDGWYCSEIMENEDGTQVAKLRFTMGEELASAELTLQDEGEYVVVSAVAIESPLYEFTGIG